MANPKEHQTVQLPDGRTLCFAEYGYHSGRPLIFFHAYPSSRLEGSGIDAMARKRGVRLICPDRPGFGHSSFQPQRKITDWPKDVQALAAHLGLQKYAVLGNTGGGPYALACAYGIPKESLSAVGMLASVGPWEAGIKDVPWSGYLLYLGATYTPKFTTFFTAGLVGLLRWIATTNYASRSLEQWLENNTDEGKRQEGLSLSERREKLLKSIFEAFAQGTAPAIQEAQILTQPWGFRFEDVQYDKTHIWHGRNDTRAPFSQIQWLAERLPHCELHETNAAHFDMTIQLDHVLDELMSEDKD